MRSYRLVEFMVVVVAIFAADVGVAADNAPTPRVLKLAKDVLDASGETARLNAYDAVFIPSLRDEIVRQYPKAGNEWRAQLDAAIAVALKEYNQEVYEENVQMYARDFTEKQLEDMLTFYRSEGGTALVRQTPSIIREKAEFGRSAGSNLVMDILNRFCGDVHCSPPKN